MRHRLILSLSMFTLLLGGCDSTRRLSELSDVLLPEPQLSALDPLRYFEFATSADPSGLDSERERLKALSDPLSDPVTAIQLSLVELSLAPESTLVQAESLARIRAMGRECTTDRCRAYVRFGVVLEALLESRHQVGATLADKTRIEAELRARIATLEAQIDALTGIEQQLIERDLPY